MSWQEEREQWNAEGRCSRKACQASLTEVAWRHPDTQLLYCTKCMEAIYRYAHPEAISRGWRFTRLEKET